MIEYSSPLAHMSQGVGTDTLVVPSPVLEIDNLSISYDTRAHEVLAVRNFSLMVQAGESIGLVGESGCGKSTVAMAIMRYLGRNGHVKSGTIRFEGRDIFSLSDAELQQMRGSRISMVYQEPFAALNPSLTIATQLLEVLIVHEGIDQKEAWDRIIQMMLEVKLPDPERILRSYPHQLSGGQQQRVVIAMALLSKPSLLLCDEPTTALDVTIEVGIIDLIWEIKEKLGTSIIFVSHNLGLIRNVCERVCVMYAGGVIEDGTIHDVFTNPQHPYTHGLFQCIPLPTANKYTRPLKAISGYLPSSHDYPKGCVFGPRCDHFQEGLCNTAPIPIKPVVGCPDHHVRCIRADEIDKERVVASECVHPPSTPGPIVLDIDKVRKYYPVYDRSLMALINGRTVRWVKANDVLSFKVRKGQTVAIVGESGCGKSTIAKVLIGLETATKGFIHFQGTEISRLPVYKRTAQQRGSLQIVFQNPNDTLNPSLSVGAQIRRVIRKFRITSNKKVTERLYELLDLVKLPRAFARRKPRQLSGGQKQRVGIARAFAGMPSLVIADEPVSALDVSVQAAVIELLMELQRKEQTTLLFISHDLGLVHYLADRVVVMYLGKIMEQGTTEEIFNPPYHPYTEALLSAIPIADSSLGHRHIVLEGNIPSTLNPPKGCPFATRCPRHLGTICDTTPPDYKVVSEGHDIACHIPVEELRKVDPVFFSIKDKNVMVG